MGRRNIKEENEVKVSKEVTKKSNTKIKMIIWIIITAFIYYQLFLIVQYSLGKIPKEKAHLYNFFNSTINMFVEKKGANIKTAEYELDVAMLGDVNLNYESSKSLRDNKDEYMKTFENIAPVLKEYDLVLASLNSSLISSDEKLVKQKAGVKISTSEVLDVLKQIGVSAIATATNNINDKNEAGIIKTLEEITAANIKQTGISDTKKDIEPLVIEKNNIKLGVISVSTNNSVKLAKDKTYMVNNLDEANLKRDINILKTKDVDFIIAYLNIPSGSSTLINSERKNAIEMLLNEGVNVVIGTGSSTLQESFEDLYEVNNTKNHIYAIYSTGDFIGDFDTQEKRVSSISNFKFTKTVKTDKNGEVIKDQTKKNMIVNPAILLYTNVEKSGKYKIYTIDEALKKYDDKSLSLTTKEYEYIKNINTTFNKTKVEI